MKDLPPTTDTGSRYDPLRSERDEWRGWLPVITLVSTFGLVLQCSLPGLTGLLLTVPVILGLPLTAALMLIHAARIAFVGQWRRSISVACAALLPALMWQSIRTGADYAHLALTACFGFGQLGNVPSPPGNVFAAYDWSIGLITNPNTFLLHDPTDEIALPPARHRHPLGDEQGFGEECAGKVDHLLGHWYVCTI